MCFPVAMYLQGWVCKIRKGVASHTFTPDLYFFQLFKFILFLRSCLPESIFGTVPSKESVRKGCHDARLKAIDHQFVQASSLFGGAIKERVQQDAVEGDILQEDGHA